MSLTFAFLPLNEKAEVRAATFNSSIFASALSSSSARPSQKYSFSGSALMFVNGSTAMELPASARDLGAQLSDVTLLAPDSVPPAVSGRFCSAVGPPGIADGTGILREIRASNCSEAGSDILRAATRSKSLFSCLRSANKSLALW